MPEDPKEKAYARVWMLSADGDFYPAVFVASVGRERGFPEERIAEALEKPKGTLSRLEERLGEGKHEYLAATASRWPTSRTPATLVRLRQLEEEGAVALSDYPHVAAWAVRIEARSSCRAAG